MAFTALLVVLIKQLRMVIWKWFEIFEQMAFIALPMAPIWQLGRDIWKRFGICELTASIVLRMVLIWQLRMGICMWFGSCEHTTFIALPMMLTWLWVEVCSRMASSSLRIMLILQLAKTVEKIEICSTAALLGVVPTEQL